jgi:hypothetical protein
MPLFFRFFKDRNAIAKNLESSAAGRNHLDPGIRKALLQLSRQTGGSGLIVSKRAVLDRDFHRATLIADIRLNPG